MINKNDLVCGTLIAPSGLQYSKTSILTGIEELFNLKGDPLTFRDQAIEQSQSPEFIQLVDEVAGCIGDEMVASVLRIKEHVIPVLKETVDKVNESFSSGRVLEKTVSGLTVKFNMIDDEFFDSALYPTGRKSEALSYATFQLRAEFPDGMLDSDALTEEQIQPFMVKHPDINRLLFDEAEYRETLQKIHSREWWGEHFSETGEYCDFTKVNSFKLRDLFRVYIVLSKLRSSETLLVPVQHISLDKYNMLINDLWEGMNVYLPILKIMCENYRLDGLVLRNKSTFELVDVPIDGVKIETLRGDCDVLFSKAYGEHLDKQGRSIAEITYNYILHIIENGGRPKVTPMAFVGIGGETYAHLPLEDLLLRNVERYREKLTDLIITVAHNCISRKLESMGVAGIDRKKLDDNFYAVGGYVRGLNIEEFDVTNIVMNSNLGGVLLDHLGLKNASKLLRYTKQAMEGEASKTNAVATAFVKFAVDYLTCENKELED